MKSSLSSGRFRPAITVIVGTSGRRLLELGWRFRGDGRSGKMPVPSLRFSPEWRSHLARSAARLPTRGTVAGHDASSVVAVEERMPRSSGRTRGEREGVRPVRLATRAALVPPAGRLPAVVFHPVRDRVTQVGRLVAGPGRARLQMFSIFPPSMRVPPARTLVQESDQVPPAWRAQRIQETP
jgi:hypothetical protein